MSAAGALATAYGVAKVFGLPRRRAVDVAHLAELFGGGGLGGVAAILGGGLELRLRPGVPPFGSVVRRSFPGPILLGVLAGPLPTRRVLQNPDFLRRFASTGDQLLAGRRTLARRDFLEMSERFTDEVRLAPPPVRSVVRALRKDGGWAAQAMFGRSVFAAPRAPGSWTRIVRDLRRSATRVFEVTAHPVHPGRTDLPATDGARAPRRA
jgi:pantoate kinase